MNPTRPMLEQTFWDDVASKDDPTPFLFDPGMGAVITNVVREGLIPGAALEIGCGIGRLTSRIAETHESCGIDISKGLIELAKRNDPLTLYRQNNGRNIPFPDGSFENVFCVTVFQHLDEDGVRSYINEAARVLMPGGHFRFQFIEGTDNAFMSKHYDAMDIFEWLDDAGLEVVTSEKGLVYDDWTWITAANE